MTGPWVANERVVSETFDGETVLIHVERGLYFSLRGAATDLWGQFRSPATRDEIAATFHQRYGDPDVAALNRAIATFVEHDLIREAAGAETGHPAAWNWAENFAPPQVETYSDLAELIAIDPVHEVDMGAGWPVRPPNFPDL